VKEVNMSQDNNARMTQALTIPYFNRPPFKAEVVGSLLRPSTIIDARRRRESGALDAAALWQIESQCVGEAVALQREVGLKVCTDGEYHRRHWFLDFVERIEGVVIRGGLPTKFHNEQGEKEFVPPRIEVHGRLRRVSPLAGREFETLKPVADRARLLPKQPIPSPTILHFRGGRAAIDRDAYPEIADFFDDLARVYREEIAALYGAGCRYLQIDDTNLPFLCDTSLRAHVKTLGEDPDALPRTYTELVNACVRDVPDDMIVGLHMCRGNHASSWIAEGGYDPIAEIVFSELDVDVFFLEYDSPRAGTFAPLRYLAPNKIAVLGLVTSKKPELEGRDELKRRIDEASRTVPLERLALSPQCGFASTIVGNSLTPAQQWDKLRLVVDTARDVWGAS
jgi:5-methyltetrahydropteroyltriglutamate--homocysteine methyltransferase